MAYNIYRSSLLGTRYISRYPNDPNDISIYPAIELPEIKGRRIPRFLYSMVDEDEIQSVFKPTVFYNRPPFLCGSKRAVNEYIEDYGQPYRVEHLRFYP